MSNRCLLAMALATTWMVGASGSQPDCLPAGQQYIFVSSWTNKSSVQVLFFDAAGPTFVWGRLDSSLDEQVESLLVIDRSTSNSCQGANAVLVATSNLCAETRKPEDCTVSTFSVHATISEQRTPITLKAISKTSSGGAGPTHLALSPSGTLLAVADYDSGFAAMIPIDEDGVLSPVSERTQKLNRSTSQAHSVAFDSRCGDDAALLLVDAGANKMATFNASDGRMNDESNTLVRPRSVIIHESLNLVYALYETHGRISVWRWQAEGSKTGSCGQLGKSEVLNVSTTWPNCTCANQSSLTEWQQTCLNAEGVNISRPFATELVLSRDGRYLYVSNGMTGFANGSIAVLAIIGMYLKLVQVYDVALGARSLALSADGGFLFTAAPHTHTMSFLRLDIATGEILGAIRTVDMVDEVSSIAVWAPTGTKLASDALVLV